MKVELAYGKTGLTVDLPDDLGADVTVIEPKFVPGLEDDAAALLEALRSPIGCAPVAAMARGLDPAQRVAIVICDATRPVPNKRIMPVLLAELAQAGIGRERITIINALGTHRPAPREELVELLGEEIVAGYRIVQHDCRDRNTMRCVGRLSTGTELWLNADYVEAGLRITTGFIEPHFFAGFSGGPKLVMPGVASLENIMEAHSYPVLASPKATWGITKGNPVHDLVREAAALGRPHFSLNVTLNKNKEITAVFAGDLDAAHERGTEYMKTVAMQCVDEPFDIVITTNSGYPLDRNLYQTVKGMCAAEGVVRQGGAIIAASQCVDGVPAGSHYDHLLLRSGTPAGAMEMISAAPEVMPDQWQVQLQARVQLKADVYLYTEGLSDGETEGAMLRPCCDISALVSKLVRETVSTEGRRARVCVLPEGPQTIPYLV